MARARAWRGHGTGAAAPLGNAIIPQARRGTLHTTDASPLPQALPPKRAFGNLQPQFVEERRIALERYLQLCLSTPEVALSSTFCNFLEADVPGRDSNLSEARRLQPPVPEAAPLWSG